MCAPPWRARERCRREFLALHLSGGTTEVLRVRPGLKIELLGGSNDLHAGQLVDRVGVRMGLSFPAGPALEALARRGTAKGAFPLSHREGEVSFSGAEAQAMRMLEAGVAKEDVAAEVYSYLARAVAWLIEWAYGKTRLGAALISGGVASSAPSARASARAPAKAELPRAPALGKAGNVGRQRLRRGAHRLGGIHPWQRS